MEFPLVGAVVLLGRIKLVRAVQDGSLLAVLPLGENCSNSPHFLREVGIQDEGFVGIEVGEGQDWGRGKGLLEVLKVGDVIFIDLEGGIIREFVLL